MQSEIIKTLEASKERFLNELFEWVRIPSISADSNYKADVIRSAQFVERSLKALGCETKILETDGFPVVYGAKVIDPKLKTVLIYGHYDVQPPDPLDQWVSPPFEPEIRDNKIFARGANDDKGQCFMHLKAVDILNQLGKQTCNVKFFIEGEEEVGSANLGQAIEKYKDLIKADVMLISDTSIISLEHPSLTVSLRGLSYLEVEVTGPCRDLHSGIYGGAVANPVNILCKMIASLHDHNNHITIPGFYDDVYELTEEERNLLNRTPFDEVDYKNQLEINDIYGEKGYSTIERASSRPTLDVNGIWGGYIGEGSKTILPSKAFAKLSMRLVPNQKNDKIVQLFSEHFLKIAPPSVKVKVMPHHGGDPFMSDTKSIAYKAAEAAMNEVFGKQPIPAREGGSIPIMALFQQQLQIPIVLMGFGLNSDGIHSPNEHYRLDNFYKGIESIALFYSHYAKMNM